MKITSMEKASENARDTLERKRVGIGESEGGNKITLTSVIIKMNESA